MFTGGLKKDLDVSPIVPVDNIVLVRLEKLLYDGQDVFPGQDVGLTDKVSLHSEFVLDDGVHGLAVVDQNLLAEAFLEHGEGLVPMPELEGLAGLWLGPQMR